MFTLSLVHQAPGIETNLVQQKFEEIFGSDLTAELKIETPEDIQELEDNLFELESIMEMSIESCYILLSDTRNNKTIKIDTYEDARSFFEEMNILASMDMEPSSHLKAEGNYWDVSENPWGTTQKETDEAKAKFQPLANPYDIDDINGASYTPDDNKVIAHWDKVHADNTEVRDVLPCARMARDLIIKDRLASFGVAFPYINENKLMNDFDKLSRMDEVTDSDLVDLLRMGFDTLGKAFNKAEELWDKWKSKREEITKMEQEITDLEEQNAKLDTKIKEQEELLQKLKDQKAGDGKIKAAENDIEKNKEERTKNKEIISKNKESIKKTGEFINQAEEKAKEAGIELNLNNPPKKDKAADNGVDKYKNDGEIQKVVDKVRKEIKNAVFKGDNHIQAARSAAYSLTDADPTAAEKLKMEINSAAKKLPSKNSKAQKA